MCWSDQSQYIPSTEIDEGAMLIQVSIQFWFTVWLMKDQNHEKGPLLCEIMTPQDPSSSQGAHVQAVLGGHQRACKKTCGNACHTIWACDVHYVFSSSQRQVFWGGIGSCSTPSCQSFGNQAAWQHHVVDLHWRDLSQALEQGNPLCTWPI